MPFSSNKAQLKSVSLFSFTCFFMNLHSEVSLGALKGAWKYDLLCWTPSSE